MPDTPDFAALLRALHGRESLRPLLAALGFTPRRGRGGDLGTNDADEPRAATVVAVRSGARAILLEYAAAVDAVRVGRFARALRDRDLVTHNLIIAAGPGWSRVLIACIGLEGELRHLAVEPARVLVSDAETLAEMAAAPGESGLAVALRHVKALDRGRVTDRFFEDFRAMRARVAAAWRGIPLTARAERDELALLLLCRLMFLCFLQRAGRLGGDRAFLANRLNEHRRAGRSGFYRQVLKPLFFGALNRRPERRSPRARALGPLPYLNGGLFERVAAERRHPRLDLPDDAAAAILDDLLERYRFAVREPGEDRLEGVSSVAVDPEMLGRVFERIMDPARRGRTGTFYTPGALVDGLVADALAAHLAARFATTAAEAERIVAGRESSELASATVPALRVLDPACGSGAFLLGVLSRLVRLAGSGDDAAVRREIVGSVLHGVDLQGDAALLCSLRLWLALALDGGDPVPPLPNLDRRIRQGDALLDPLDLAAAGPHAPLERRALADGRVRASLRDLPALGARYLEAGPIERPAIQRRLSAAERELARAWAAAVARSLANTARELRALAAGRDLWGQADADAVRAREALRPIVTTARELRALRQRIARDNELPFFSFRVHFAEATAAGFDLVLSNPPWVRAHHWPASLRRLARARFAVSRDAGWPEGARLAGAPAAAGAQVDLSQLFLEKSVALLAANGAVGAVLPAKTFRSLYGGGARALLLRETRLYSIHDYGLDHRAVFAADAFAGTVVATRGASGGAEVRVRLSARGRAPLRCDAPQAALPLFPDDPRSPWLLAPEPARRAFRRMQTAGPPIGRHDGLRVRRGVFTGANDVLLVDRAVPRLGGLAGIRAEGHDGGAGFEAVVEAACLRPVLRGSGVSAWRFETRGMVVWLHGADGRAVEPPRLISRYMARHGARLSARHGTRAGRSDGSVFRAGPWTIGPKVAWQDLAADIEAVYVPAVVPDGLGSTGPVVPLNTVYFLPVSDREAGLVLAAILNSLPLRTFARAIAERAKDARFRFFAWTISCLPLPGDWRTGRQAAALLRLSESAHADGRLTGDARAELDRLATRMYGLSPDDVRALRELDAWFRGDPVPAGPAP